mmetsp:Transcript_12406/g.35880  ORF Transcript_12406/g.35880 Transcript_12406/m.35880 type:complete len:314 (+) Transcript_12406:992-1933(+)
MRERFLVVGEAGVSESPLMDKALGIDEPNLLPRLFHALARFLANGHGDQLGNADAGLASTEKEEVVLGQLTSRNSRGSKDTREAHRCGALDVVVEAAGLVLVVLEEAKGIGVPKVFELDENLRAEHRLTALDELVDKGIVLWASQSLLSQADVELVLQELVIVGAHVDVHGQAPSGVHPSAGRVERQLANGNAHAIRSQVAEAEDTFAIRDDNGLHLAMLGSISSEDLRDSPLIVDGQVQTPGSSQVKFGPCLAGCTDGWCVHVGHALSCVLGQESKEEALVDVLNALQVAVLVQRFTLLPKVRQSKLLLHLE